MIDKRELTQRLDRLDALFRDDGSEALKEYKQWVRDIIKLCAPEKVEEVEGADAIKALKTIHDYCRNMPTWDRDRCAIDGWCDKLALDTLPQNWEIDTWIKK